MNKYIRLEIDFDYNRYYEEEREKLNGYTKNKIHKSGSEFFILCDIQDKIKSKEKLKKHFENYCKEVLKKFNDENRNKRLTC
jgi:hypothetical protein